MLSCSLRQTARHCLPRRAPPQAQARLLGSGRLLRSQEDDRFKDDPDVRSILSDIRTDFDQTKGPPASEATEERPDEKAEGGGGPTGGPAPVRDMAALLERIYGAERGGADRGAVGGYTEYRDSDARVILDVDEEREVLRRAAQEGRELEPERRSKPTAGAKYQESFTGRGARGVFEVAELVKILQQEKLHDVVVVRVPEERQYCDHLVIATGRNSRHIGVVSTTILSVFKSRMLESDKVPTREGGDQPSCGWIAMDMGNVALHLFDQDQREHYDLESLWALGPQFDEHTRSLPQQDDRNLTALERLMAVPEEGRAGQEEGQARQGLRANWIDTHKLDHINGKSTLV